MAKKLLVLALAAIMMLSVFGLTACNQSGKHKIYEDGYFQYIIVGENSRFPQKGEDGVVAIVGFTELGKEQEVIDFPREIDGKPVMRIGYRDEGFYHNNSHHVYSEKLRKIYVHDNIKDIVYFDGSEVDMMVCSISYDIVFERGVIFKGIYIYKSLFDGANYSSSFSPANVAFLYNFSTQNADNYYRLDNIDSGNKIPEPPVPERAGYYFIGWYIEHECINAWDFEAVPTIAENTEFKLYAKWQEE